MNSRFLCFIFIFSITVISCTSDDNIDLPQQNDNSFKVNENTEELRSSVRLEGAGVLGVRSISHDKQRQQSRAANAAGELRIGLEQIAFIEPPSVNGVLLRANHVDVQGNYAYVAYTKEGSVYLGGIDIIDISNKYEPRVVNRMTTAEADVNALYFKDNKIFFTGAAMSDLAQKAFVGSVSSMNGEFISDFSTNSLPGRTGVDILPVEDNVLVITGSDGSAGFYNQQDLTMQEENLYPDLRSAAYVNGSLVALSGDSGLLFLNNLNLATRKTVGISDLVEESKRTMAFMDNLLLVSEGPNGVGVYDPNSGFLVTRIPIQTLPDMDVNENDKVTNAVSFIDGYVLMSNGGAGFGISMLDQNHKTAEEGVVEIDGSSNYIKAVGDYIFVASGAGGLRIIKLSKPAEDISNQIVADCTSYPVYEGSKILNINSNEEKEFRGTITLNNLNIKHILSFCGSLNIEKSVNIYKNGNFNMNGALAVGTVGSSSHLSLSSGSVLRIQGSLTVYGDLNLKKGATIEFIGDKSSIHVYGEVKKQREVSIKGDYTDTSNKL